jgi:hypothetical protein
LHKVGLPRREGFFWRFQRPEHVSMASNIALHHSDIPVNWIFRVWHHGHDIIGELLIPLVTSHHAFGQNQGLLIEVGTGVF